MLAAMRHTWVVALVLGVVASACSKKDDKPKAKVDPDELEEDPECAEKMPPFGEWMKALVSDGNVGVIAPGVELATLPGMPPGQITRGAPIVIAKADGIAVDGAAAADPKAAGAAIEPKPGTDVVLVIDGKVPWSSVSALMAATAAAKHPRITLVFAPGSPAVASEPPRSAVDAELAAIATSGGKDTELTAKIFKDCAAVTQKLLPALEKIENPSEWEVAAAVGMPEEIGLCGCRVDLPSVQRLMWSWWRRDRGPALAAIRIELVGSAKEGLEVTAAPETPWSEAAGLVITAAEQRKPLYLH
jgi:hypothetical protein